MEQEYQPVRKKGSTAKGIVIGVIATLLIGCVAVNVGCIATNSKILITSKDSGTKGSSVLSADTISKINELNAYINTYYYDDVDTADLQDGLYKGLLQCQRL